MARVSTVDVARRHRDARAGPLQRRARLAVDAEDDGASRRHRLEHLRRQHRLEHVARLQRHQRDVGGGQDPGHLVAGTRPVNRTLGRPSRAAAARSASSSAPSPTISTFTAGATVCSRAAAASTVERPCAIPIGPDVAGQHVGVLETERRALVRAPRRAPERRHDPVRHEVQLRRLDAPGGERTDEALGHADDRRRRRDTCAVRAVRAGAAQTMRASHRPRVSTPATGRAARTPRASAAAACRSRSRRRRRTAATCRSPRRTGPAARHEAPPSE